MCLSLVLSVAYQMFAQPSGIFENVLLLCFDGISIWNTHLIPQANIDAIVLFLIDFVDESKCHDNIMWPIY